MILYPTLKKTAFGHCSLCNNCNVCLLIVAKADMVLEKKEGGYIMKDDQSSKKTWLSLFFNKNNWYGIKGTVAEKRPTVREIFKKKNLKQKIEKVRELGFPKK